MWKLLATTLLLSSFVQASVTSEKIEDYLDNEFGDNPRIKSLTISVTHEKPLDDLKGWSSYVVEINAYLKEKPKDLIKQSMIWFSNGDVITKELIRLDDNTLYSDLVKPNLTYYKKENLVYGNVNARHKVAIFSDPLCPFCKSFAPEALRYMKRHPNKYAVYYYHYPILRIHPASGIIVRAAIVAQRKGIIDVSIKMYDIKIDAREKNVKKIITAFNKAVGSNVTEKEILDPSILKQLREDDNIAKSLFVSGTPTIYLDGKIDKTRNKYKKVK